MDLKKNRFMKCKRGIVFTILAIVLAIFFTIIFSARIEKPIDYKVSLVESRINVLYDYLNNFFEYSEIVGTISGYTAMNGTIMDINNSYKPGFENDFTNCIKMGYVTPLIPCLGMENRTLPYFLNQIENLAQSELNINSKYTINSINVTQNIDAFYFEVVVNLSVEINDEFANMSNTKIVVSSVSIEGLPDPLYLLNGTYNQTIKKNSLKKEVGANWTWQDLKQLYTNHSYRQYPEASSFLGRIRGDLSPSPIGIESFVNHTNPSVFPIGVNHSMVDYLFWNKIEGDCKRDIIEIINNSIINSSGNPVNFQLDESHRFSISSQDINFTC